MSPSSLFLNLISGALWALIDLYAAGALIYLVLKLAAGDRLWPVAVLNNLAGPLLLPSLPLLALAAWQARWAEAAALGLGALGFIWLFGDLFLPRLGRPRAGATRLRVMSFNMLSTWSSTEAVLDEIRQVDADVVGLVEFPRARAEAIAAQLGEVYPHQVQYRDGIPGVGLVSKYPIVEAENFELSYAKLTHVRAVVDAGGRRLTVFVAHPPPPAFMPIYTPRGASDIAELARRTTSDGPALLMGDFNTADVSDDYRILRRAGLVDAFRAAGLGFGWTWPARNWRRRMRPLVRIDYIWHTRHFTATRAWVGARTGSDHLPVIAELEWKDGNKKE